MGLYKGFQAEKLKVIRILVSHLCFQVVTFVDCKMQQIQSFDPPYTFCKMASIFLLAQTNFSSSHANEFLLAESSPHRPG
jgi:hypothetical protein